MPYIIMSVDLVEANEFLLGFFRRSALSFLVIIGIYWTKDKQSINYKDIPAKASLACAFSHPSNVSQCLVIV